MDFSALLSLAISLAPAIQKLVNTGVSFKNVMTAIAGTPLVQEMEAIGAKMFPDLSPALHAVAAVVVHYSPDYTMWVQGSLNDLLALSPPLVVDGIYGPKTKAAVKAFQAAEGLNPDSFAGDITSAAIQAALVRAPKVS